MPGEKLTKEKLASRVIEISQLKEVVATVARVLGRQRMSCNRLELFIKLMMYHDTFGLRLSEMVKGRDFDVMHDALGISSNYDTLTGEMLNGFLPRYAIHD